MKYLTLILFSLLLVSCFNGRITIQNNSNNFLKIATAPIISSGSGGWENGIHYYNRDSIIWNAALPKGKIQTKILQPNTWKTSDSIYVQKQPGGYHYGDYSRFQSDTNVRGVYLMYPNSSFTIGEFNRRKKLVATKDNVNGKFFINTLIVYRTNDTLVANGDKDIWNLLLQLDENNSNFSKNKQRKKVRHWTAFIKP